MLDTIVRAYKGALRSPLRTALVIGLLAVGLSFALTSVALALAAQDELDKVKATAGVEASITVNPDQFQAAIQEQLEQADEDGGDLDIGETELDIQELTAKDVEAVKALPYVRNAEGITTTLVSYTLSGEEATDDESADEGQSRPDQSRRCSRRPLAAGTVRRAGQYRPWLA